MATQAQESPQKPMVKKKKLEYGVVTWQFKNILPSVLASMKHTSAIFKIKSDSACRWVLKLDCKLNEKNNEGIYIYLKRCLTAEGPLKVPVSFKCGFRKGNDEVSWLSEDKQHAFEMKDKQRVFIPGINECFKSIFSTTDITIYCMMTAWYGEYLVKQSAEELLELSDDFLSIFQNERMPDLTLTCEGGTINAHRGILATRSKYFEKSLQIPNNNVLNIPKVNLEMMTDLISFLYSGNWDAMLKDFVHTDMKAYSQIFEIPDLFEKFNPQEIILLDRNDCERLEYTWKIKSFSLLMNRENKLISCQTFRSCSPELSKIPVNMTASMEKNGELHISLTCFKFEVICEVCIIDAKGQKYFEDNLPELPTPGTPAKFKFNINQLLSKNQELYIPQDTLTIHCSVNFYKNKDEPMIKAEKCMRVEDFNFVSGVEKLAKDMKNLLKTKLYPDLTLYIRKNKHKVHKAILANRPSELKSKIAGLDPSTNFLTIKIPDKEFDSLIQFVYTGSKPTEILSETKN